MKKGDLISILIGAVIGLFFGMFHVKAVLNTEPEVELPVAESYIVEMETASSEQPVIEYKEIDPLEGKLDPDIPEEVQRAANYYGYVYNICPEFLEAIAFYESSYQATAENGSCKGLMQINVDAQLERMEEMGITEDDLWNPYNSMAVASDYLAELFDRYEDCAVVLMKYNGDRKVWEYTERGEMSAYAAKVLTLSAELEEKHGKLDQNGRGGFYEEIK